VRPVTSNGLRIVTSANGRTKAGQGRAGLTTWSVHTVPTSLTSGGRPYCPTTSGRMDPARATIPRARGAPSFWVLSDRAPLRADVTGGLTAVDSNATRRLWWAYRIASPVAPLAFCVVLWAGGLVWCGVLGMKCNAIGFVFVPIVAIVVGLPVAYLVALLLMPLALRLRRRNQLTRGAVLLIAAGVTVVFDAVMAWTLLANTTPVPHDRFATWVQFSAISVVGVAPPIFLAALVFHRIAVPAAAPVESGPPPVGVRAWLARHSRVRAAALAGCAAFGVFGAWVAIYQPGEPGTRIHFQTRPGVPIIWESAPGEPKDLLDRLEDEGFPTAHSAAHGGGRRDPNPGTGSVSLVRWRDRPSTRERVIAWLRAQPEVTSVWIDSTTTSRSQRIKP
jgi:hypothetical protein